MNQLNDTTRPFPVIDTLAPFILIGIIGSVGSWAAQKFGVPAVFSWIELEPVEDFRDIVFEHVAPKSLVYSLLFVLLLSTMSRMIFGSLVNGPNVFYSKVIQPYYRFSWLMAVGMLGVFIGVAVGALATFNFLYALGFFTFCIYPLAYLYLLSLSVRFVFPLNYGFPNFDDDPFVSRGLGLISILAFFMVALGWPYIEYSFDLVGSTIANEF